MANKKLRFVALIVVVMALVCMLVACTTTATSSVSYKVTIHSDGQSDIVWDRQTGFPTLSKEHHTVAGLYLDAEYKTAVTPEDLVNMFLTSDIDVYVKYDRVHYSITVHPLNGGSDVIWYNEPGNKKPEFKKVGYVMSGFYFDENCTQPADSVFTEDILENKEVWVKWVECDHKALAPADWTVDKPVTCTVDGHKIATCPTCDKTLEETIEALGHKYAEDWTIDKDATCTVDGSKSHHCTNEGCDSVSDVTVIPASHTFGEWIAEVPATCTTLGTKGHKDCSVCKKSFTASNVEIEDLTIAIDPNNHDIEHHTAKAPTCTEIGWDAYDTCKRAGCEYTTYHQLDAIGHKYGNVVYAWADDHSTCTAKHVCQNGTCGHEETATATVTPVKTQNATCQQVELTKYTATFTADWAETQIVENVQTADRLAHSYTEPKKDADYHWNECSCGAVEPNSKVAHSGGTATCTNKAVCSCGQEYGELKAHAFGTLIVEVPATCKGTGTKAHYQCSACEQYFDIDRKAVTEADLVISATGHKWSEVSYTWATKAREDGVESLTCTASRYCLYDAQEKEELIAWLNVANPTITASKVQDVSCTQDEKYTYTTRFNAIGTTFATEQTITLVTQEKLGHDLTIKKVHTVVDGVVTDSGHWYKCQREGCEYATEKVAHTWNNGVQSKPPTEEVEGEKTYTCTVCLLEKIEYTGKLDHDHTFDADTWKYSDSHHWHPATCKHTEEKDGYAEHTYGIVSYIWSEDYTSCEARRSCACGYVQTEKATITTSVTPATCTTKEYTTYTATFKNTAFEEQIKANIETGNALGHEYGTWIAEVPATCMQTGTLGHYHCSRTGCGKDFDADHQELASLTNAIDENAHQYTAWVPNNNGTHTKTCQNNTAHTVTENCSGGSATCTEQATCSACNGKYNNVLGHNIVLDTTKGTNGYTWSDDHTVCTAYGKCDRTGCTHTIDATATVTSDKTQSATCQQVELTKYTAMFTADWAEAQIAENVQTADKADHNYSGDWTIDKTANCTEGGSKSHHCLTEGCGSKSDETPITALGHNIVLDTTKGTNGYTWSDDHTACTAHGKCDRTGCTHTEDATATVTSDKTQNATCQQVELTKYTATFTADWAEAQIAENIQTADKADHKYTNYTSDGNATCTEDGTKTATCDHGCGTTDTITDKGTALEHDYSWSSNGDGTHTGTCSRNAEHTVTEDCSGGNATCTEQAECSVCHEKYGELGGHTYGDLINKVSESCTTDGKEAHYHCACGQYFNESKEPVEESSLVINAHHTLGTLVNETTAKIDTDGTFVDGMKAHYQCSACEGYFDADQQATTKDELTIAFDRDKQYSVEEIIELTKDIAKNNNTQGMLYVEGIVKSGFTNNTTYVQQLYIIDENDSTKEFLVYTCRFTEEITAIYAGDTVVVYGYIKNYNGTLEVATVNSTNASFISRTAGQGTVTVATDSSNKATVSDITPSSGDNGTSFTFTVTASEGYEVASVKVNGTEVTAAEDGTYTGTIQGTTTITVETQEAGLTVVATALFGSSYNSKNVQNYTSTWTATNGGNTFTIVNFNNNNNSWTYIKCGSKNNASVASIVNASAFTQAITKIKITIDAINVDDVNSMNLYISTSMADIDSATPISFKPSKAGTVTISIDEPIANAFYKMVFDCKKGSNNGFVQISKIEYYAVESSTEGGESGGTEGGGTGEGETTTMTMHLYAPDWTEVGIHTWNGYVTGEWGTVTMTADAENTGWWIYTFEVETSRLANPGINVIFFDKINDTEDTPVRLTTYTNDASYVYFNANKGNDNKFTSMADALATEGGSTTDPTPAEQFTVDFAAPTDANLTVKNGETGVTSGSQVDKDTVLTIIVSSTDTTKEVSKVLVNGTDEIDLTLNEEDGSWSGTYTVTGDITSITVELTAKSPSGGTDTPSTGTETTVTMAYSGSTTSNMTGNKANNAAKVGLDANVFTVESATPNSGTNHVGLNSSGQIRIYGSNKCELTVSIASGYEIVSIKITLNQGSVQVKNADGNAFTATGDTYNIGGQTFVITNNDSSQARITSIVITYKETESGTEGGGTGEGGSTTSTITISASNATVKDVDGNEITSSATVNNGEFKFTVTPADGYQVDSVTAGETTLTATEGVYTINVTADTTITIATSAIEDSGSTGGEGGTDTPSTGTSTEVEMSFADTTQRVSQDGNSQVWQSGDVTFTNDKANSTNNVVGNVNPIRLYQNSTVIIKAKSKITKIVFTSDSADKYKTALDNSISSLGTVTVKGGVYELVLKTPNEEIQFTCTAQIRLLTMVVTVEA